MLSKGIILYSILTMTVWVFAHFAYIGTNLLYISEQLKIIDTMVDLNIKQNIKLPNKNNFVIYNGTDPIQFKNDLLIKYSNPKYKKEEYDFIKDWTIQMMSKQENDYSHETVFKLRNKKFDDITDFWQWCSFAFNSGDIKVTKDKLIMSGMIFPARANLKTTPVKHVIIYVKVFNGKLYTYNDVNSVFKDNHENFIFNEFYMVFHFLYWIFFTILFLHHKKNVFPQKK